jgi:ligand-binding sensor domain-containing protein
MRREATLTLIIWLIAGLYTAEAQWVNFSMESTAGIAANTVRDIVKGNSGDLWFATENGVFRNVGGDNAWVAYHVSNSDLRRRTP